MTDAVPKTLYRYRSMSRNDLNALSQHYLWFSSREKLNDPFELEAIPQTILPCPHEDPEGIAHLLRLGGANEQQIRNLLANPNIKYEVLQQKKAWQKGSREIYESFKERTKVCCFAEQPDNILMWSHYGDALKGVVFGFDVETVADGSPVDEIFIPVSYPTENKVPEVNVIDIYINKSSESLETSVEVSKAMFATKANEWKYEREWRILNENNKVPYNRNAIVEVIWGERTPERVKMEVKRSLLGCDVSYKRAVRSKRKFRLELISE